MHRSKIDWADYVWNPVWGCNNTCPYCYARTLAHRFRKSFEPHWMQANYNRPMPKNPSLIFVNSMSDVAYWNLHWLGATWCRIRAHPEHRFLYLTKLCGTYLGWEDIAPTNAWLGVTAVDAKALDVARVIPKAMGLRFKTVLSAEPLHGPIDGVRWFNWVIMGAETGNRRDRVTPRVQWITAIRDECADAGVPLWMKDNLRPYWPGELVQQRPLLTD